MRFGVILPIQLKDTPLDQHWEELRKEVAVAEDAGFDAVLVMDHFYQLPMLGPIQHEMLEAYPLLGGLAGNLLALMGVGNLATSLVVPVLAHRRPGQRGLVVPSLIGTAAGLAGALWAPLGSAPFWVLVLGVSQGSCLGLAIFFMLARAPDAGVAASLSAFAQSVGYLVASAGPLVVGLLHSVTGSWNLPVALLLVLCAAELATGLLAGRPLQLPSVTPPPAPETRNTTRVSGTG
jgi:MFS family permease